MLACPLPSSEVKSYGSYKVSITQKLLEKSRVSGKGTLKLQRKQQKGGRGIEERDWDSFMFFLSNN